MGKLPSKKPNVFKPVTSTLYPTTQDSWTLPPPQQSDKLLILSYAEPDFEKVELAASGDKVQTSNEW